MGKGFPTCRTFGPAKWSHIGYLKRKLSLEKARAISSSFPIPFGPSPTRADDPRTYNGWICQTCNGQLGVAPIKQVKAKVKVSKDKYKGKGKQAMRPEPFSDIEHLQKFFGWELGQDLPVLSCEPYTGPSVGSILLMAGIPADEIPAECW